MRESKTHYSIKRIRACSMGMRKKQWMLLLLLWGKYARQFLFRGAEIKPAPLAIQSLTVPAVRFRLQNLTRQLTCQSNNKHLSAPIFFHDKIFLKIMLR